ncbi:MAG TPA: AmmeMemoRadiSam system protein B, partial [bacterium (Candidatus Stahlbacteria)]|nr:AmmeMemoRadiSam system protein B [Candidatus Stahlbacteria bacterium]
MIDPRPPVFAGQFYPDSPAELKKMLERFSREPLAEGETIGAVAPHAGYQFSGSVA